MGKEKPFYGKWIVFGSLMITTFAMAIINNTTAFYMTPICNELGFSTAAFSGCYSMSAVGAALGAILAGSLLKKIPIRVMMTIGAAGTALAFMGLSIANQLWQFYVLLLITDLCMAFITNVPLTTMINNWYVAKRGMMTGLVFAGAGLGSIVLSPLCEYLIQSMGWHATATVSGLIILVTALPVCLFIFRTAPEDMGQKPFTYPKGSPEALKEAAKGDTDTQSTADNKEGVPKKIAIRSSAFGLLVLGLLCMGMVCSGVMVHIPNFLYALDMNAGFVISVLSIGMLIGTFANGIIVDKLGLVKDLLFVTILFILGMLCLLFTTPKTAFLPYIMALLVGFSVCISTVGPPMLTSSIFGMKDYAALYGLVYALFLVGCVLGPVVCGLVYQMSGGYSMVWILYLFIALGMFLFPTMAIKAGKTLRRKAKEAEAK